MTGGTQGTCGKVCAFPGSLSTGLEPDSNSAFVFGANLLSSLQFPNQFLLTGLSSPSYHSAPFPLHIHSPNYEDGSGIRQGFG